MDKIKILLIDDHRLIRDTRSLMLSNDPRFDVIGVTGNAEEAIDIVKAQKPGIILMDVNMSPIDGFDLTRSILAIAQDSKIIAVTMHNIPAYAKKMFQLGARGYVTKNASNDEMVEAILQVNQGKKYISAEIKDTMSRQSWDQEDGSAEIKDLSSRELEVIKLIKEGFTSKAIAAELSISRKTVEVHRYNILKKLQLKNTASLVNYINTHGL